MAHNTTAIEQQHRRSKQLPGGTAQLGVARQTHNMGGTPHAEPWGVARHPKCCTKNGRVRHLAMVQRAATGHSILPLPQCARPAGPSKSDEGMEPKPPRIDKQGQLVRIILQGKITREADERRRYDELQMRVLLQEQKLQGRSGMQIRAHGFGGMKSKVQPRRTRPNEGEGRKTAKADANKENQVKQGRGAETRE